MARKKKHRSWKLPLSIETIEKLARKLMDDHMASLISPDHHICKTSGVWRKANGTLTCRFAYRRTKGGSSIVQTFHNVPDPRTWENSPGV
jgi:hypothetical protein